MIPFPLNSGAAVLDLTEIDLEDPEYAGDPAQLDLLELAPHKELAAVVVTARTSNEVGTPTSLLIYYAFSPTAFADPADAPIELFTRAATITATLGLSTGSGPDRQFSSGRVAISGRYLYLWWGTAGNSAADTIDLSVTVEAIP